MRSRALRICLVADLAMFGLLYGSYCILEYYERLESVTHSSYMEPGLLFGLCFMVTVAALITTLIVALFWRDDTGPPGTGFSRG